MTPGTLLGGLAAVGGASVGVYFLIAVGKWLVRVGRRVDDFLGDWHGEPDRPGVPGRSGVMARIAHLEQQQAQLCERVGVIEHEVTPNSGASIKDAVTRIDRRTAAQQEGDG